MRTLRPAGCLVLLCLTWTPPAAAEVPGGSTAPSHQDAAAAPVRRLRFFFDAAVLSPGPYALAFGGGVIDELSTFPEEWTGSKGFGQRFLARVASGFASDVIGHGMAAVLDHQVRYEACQCSGGWKRTAHAVSRGFVTRNARGELVMHSSVFIAKFGAAGLAATWYPASYAGADIAREGVAGIGVNAGLNIAREFAPELLRLIGLGRP